MLLSCVYVDFQGPAEKAVCDLEKFSAVRSCVKYRKSGQCEIPAFLPKGPRTPDIFYSHP